MSKSLPLNPSAHIFGFSLMARGSEIEFFSYNEEEIKTWISYLNKMVILLDLKTDYAIMKLLGKGNFAKVHVCKNKHTG